ncbi:50S ribosomal protein L25/general stress protein Ctc [Nocardiopsis sp. TSRI0078]|uniref:50S ribosomal protein L25/general stress protein Ctc n=1 Tax=unclassified Nocardiopsis TaxID=2649073 RepID=UPI00093E20C8|nr:50S ribosomal protein L25/general stress protein Ctc [Nocardiopsis sp. TSRI0078]OKI21904.1 50S ribosomal protein L25/general stress protein Ctc [Nocardiopsis sp. TSRI0078]
MSEVRIAAEPRTEFGKGASRRARRAGKVPAVLYGHGTEPRHLNLPGHDLMLALKTPNVLIRLDGVDKDNLALPKSVQRDAIKGFLEHVDLLVVSKGEKVEVEIPIHLTGEVKAPGVLTQELVTVAVEAEATHIPEGVDFDVEGLEVGTTKTAADIKLPAGTSLASDPETILLTVSAPRVEDEPETSEEAAESESTEEASAE